MSWHDRTINHWHCFLEAWYLVSSCVCSLLFDIKADLWEGKKGGMAALLPSNSLPTQGCKSLWKFYATEINLQPADPPPHAWKCGTDGAVLSVGITYWGDWLCTRTLSVFNPLTGGSWGEWVEKSMEKHYDIPVSGWGLSWAGKHRLRGFLLTRDKNFWRTTVEMDFVAPLERP